jgi:uncharacterized SAM-dependent methyltransferase
MPSVLSNGYFHDESDDDSKTIPYGEYLKGHPEKFYDPEFMQDMKDLLSGRRAGHAFHHVMTGEGYRLWEQFTRAVDTTYYPFNDEAQLIESNPDWFRITSGLAVGEGSIVAELGTGSEYSAQRKTMPFIEAVNASVYVGVDKSIDSVISVLGYINDNRPQTKLFMRLNDFNKDALQLDWQDLPSPILTEAHEWYGFAKQEMSKEEPKTRILAQFGTTLGNIEAFIDDEPPMNKVVANLRNYRANMRPGDKLFLGLDQNQDEASLHSSYSSPIIAKFSLEMLRRIGNELPVKGNFNPDDFDYVRMWNKRNGLYFHGYEFKKTGHFWLGDEKIKTSKNSKVSYVNTWKLSQEFMETAFKLSDLKQIGRLDGAGNRIHIHALEAI